MTTSRYKSSIPANAKVRILERYESGATRHAEYHLAGKRVGVRWFFETGELECEYALKNGKKQGTEYDWHLPGFLCSAEPFVNGVCHGAFRQWGNDGRPIGSYRMVRGTGIDLWQQQRPDGSIYLSEVAHCRSGSLHGFQWNIEDNQKSVWSEHHCQNGLPHGIEREWNQAKRLRRGYPKYYIAGKAVTKRQYLKAAKSDPTLPPLQPQDNKPARTFPPRIARHLRR